MAVLSFNELPSTTMYYDEPFSYFSLKLSINYLGQKPCTDLLLHSTVQHLRVEGEQRRNGEMLLFTFSPEMSLVRGWSAQVTKQRQNYCRKTASENLTKHLSLLCHFYLFLHEASIPSFPSSFRTDSWEDSWLVLEHHIVVTPWGSPWDQNAQKEKQTHISFTLTPGHILPEPEQSTTFTSSLCPSLSRLTWLHTEASNAHAMQLHCAASSSQPLEADGFPWIRCFHISPSNKGLTWSSLQFHKSYQHYPWTLKASPIEMKIQVEYSTTG